VFGSDQLLDGTSNQETGGKCQGDSIQGLNLYDLKLGGKK
jgi:hypothetical protein